MNERLIKIMIHYGLSPSEFADELGVIRSTISHIMSGRNKPGVEVIQRTLTQYRQINPYWLLLGEGEMLRNGDASPKEPQNQVTNVNNDQVHADEVITDTTHKNEPFFNSQMQGPNTNEKKKNFTPGQDELINQSNDRPAEKPALELLSEKRNIKRITVYYDSNFFQDFYPG